PASAAPPLTFRVSTRSGAPSPPEPAGPRTRRASLTGGSCQATMNAAGTARISAIHHEDQAATATPATAGTVPAGASAASLGPGLGGRPPAARAARNGRATRASATATTTLTGAHHLNSSGPAAVIGGGHLIIPGNAARLAAGATPRARRAGPAARRWGGKR